MIDITIKPDGDDEFKVTVDTRDIVLWEKTSKGRSFNDAVERKSFVDMYRLAHLAAKRQQLFTGSLEEFEQTCVIDVSGDDEEDPTQPAQ